VAAAFREVGDEVLALARSDFDLTSAFAGSRVAVWRPDVVINCAAWTDVDGCARDPKRADEVNGHAAGRLADATANALFVQISTNEIFAGDRAEPYREDDQPSPVNAYGRSKLIGEYRVRAANPQALIARTAWLFGPGGTNFVTKILDAADRLRQVGGALRVVNDEWGNPTWAPSLAAAIVAAVTATERPPIIHLAGRPPTTRYGWASRAIEQASIDVPVEAISGAEFVRASKPPPRAVLDISLADRLGLAPVEWHAPLDEYVKSLRA
jgi:dTDP-4-dehydrorhamnose reductase